jgi:hypothetical protein
MIYYVDIIEEQAKIKPLISGGPCSTLGNMPAKRCNVDIADLCGI